LHQQYFNNANVAPAILAICLRLSGHSYHRKLSGGIFLVFGDTTGLLASLPALIIAGIPAAQTKIQVLTTVWMAMLGLSGAEFRVLSPIRSLHFVLDYTFSARALGRRL